MGAPLPPNSIMPWAWSLKAELRGLPGDPGMEKDTAFWIEELSAWIADDDEDADYLREILGSSARVLLGSELPPHDP